MWLLSFKKNYFLKNRFLNEGRLWKLHSWKRNHWVQRSDLPVSPVESRRQWSRNECVWRPLLWSTKLQVWPCEGIKSEIKMTSKIIRLWVGKSVFKIDFPECLVRIFRKWKYESLLQRVWSLFNIQVHIGHPLALQNSDFFPGTISLLIWSMAGIISLYFIPFLSQSWVKRVRTTAEYKLKTGMGDNEV